MPQLWFHYRAPIAQNFRLAMRQPAGAAARPRLPPASYRQRDAFRRAGRAAAARQGA